MRTTTVGLEIGELLGGQGQCLPSIDGRQATCTPDLAPQVLFLGRFKAGIKHPGLLQSLNSGIIDVHAPRLIVCGIREDAQPMQIIEDGIGVFLFRAHRIGIVKTLTEAALVLLRKQPVEKRGARVADMDAAGGRWGKTDGNCHERGVADELDLGKAGLKTSIRRKYGQFRSSKKSNGPPLSKRPALFAKDCRIRPGPWSIQAPVARTAGGRCHRSAG